MCLHPCLPVDYVCSSITIAANEAMKFSESMQDFSAFLPLGSYLPNVNSFPSPRKWDIVNNFDLITTWPDLCFRSFLSQFNREHIYAKERQELGRIVIGNCNKLKAG